MIKRENADSQRLTFADIEKISGVPIDHSFLRYKKELEAYGFYVDKISQKEQTVTVKKREGYSI